MSRGTGLDVAMLVPAHDRAISALAERVAELEAQVDTQGEALRVLVNALVEGLPVVCDDRWAEGMVRLGGRAINALDAAAPDVGGLPASFMWGGESWQRCQCDPDDRAGGITYTDMMPPQCDDCQRHIPPVTARPRHVGAPPLAAPTSSRSAKEMTRQEFAQEYLGRFDHEVATDESDPGPPYVVQRVLDFMRKRAAWLEGKHPGDGATLEVWADELEAWACALPPEQDGDA